MKIANFVSTIFEFEIHDNPSSDKNRKILSSQYPFEASFWTNFKETKQNGSYLSLENENSPTNFLISLFSHFSTNIPVSACRSTLLSKTVQPPQLDSRVSDFPLSSSSRFPEQIPPPITYRSSRCKFNRDNLSKIVSRRQLLTFDTPRSIINWHLTAEPCKIIRGNHDVEFIGLLTHTHIHREKFHNVKSWNSSGSRETHGDIRPFLRRIAKRYARIISPR